jgi:hypothetical protein
VRLATNKILPKGEAKPFGYSVSDLSIGEDDQMSTTKQLVSSPTLGAPVAGAVQRLKIVE